MTISCLGEVVERCLDAAFAVRNVGEAKAHRYAAQRARQHQVVEVAKVADPKNLAFHLTKPGPEGHVKVIEDETAHRVGVVPVGQQDSRERVGVLVGVAADNFEIPGTDGPPGRFGEAIVAGKHVVEPFVEQHRERFVEAEE